MLGILLVAWFPLAAGPFTATHGPVTALQAVMRALRLLIAISFLPMALIAVVNRTRCEHLHFFPGSCDLAKILPLRY